MKRELLGKTLLSPYAAEKEEFSMREFLLSVLVLALAVLPACSSNRPEKQPIEEQNQNGEQLQPSPNEILAAEVAQQYALSHAQLTAEEVTGLRTEYDRDDNVYEVEFNHNGWEYDYEIHALSGAVLSSVQKRQG